MMTSPRFRTALLIGLCAPLSVTPLLAQRSLPAPPTPPDAPTAPRAPRAQVYINGQALKPGGRLGVTLRTGTGASDTLGVLIGDVEEGAPADKAGIREGARIVSIDGIDLRLDPRDIGDAAAEMLPESRLRRRLSALSPGETVTIDVRQDGRTDSKRVTLAASPTARIFSSGGSPTMRRVLGLGFSQRGTMRDTAGLLITSITEGSAAEKAGLMEGDRVVSIDGVDLRVPSADAGSPDGVEARISRLRRALDATRDSQPVRLEILSEGRRRTLSITPTLERSWGMSFGPGQWEELANGMRGAVNLNLDLTDSDRRDIARARGEALRAREEAQRDMREAQRDMQRAQRDMQREMQREMRDGQRDVPRARVGIERSERRERDIRVERDDDDDANAGARSESPARSDVIRGRTDGATLSLDGLTLASVDRDFAQQFGQGADRGALVVRASDTWAPLRAGDVILRIDGRSVRDGNALDVSVDRARDVRIEILRNGRAQTVTLRASR